VVLLRPLARIMVHARDGASASAALLVPAASSLPRRAAVATLSARSVPVAAVVLLLPLARIMVYARDSASASAALRVPAASSLPRRAAVATSSVGSAAVVLLLPLARIMVHARDSASASAAALPGRAATAFLGVIPHLWPLCTPPSCRSKLRASLRHNCSGHMWYHTSLPLRVRLLVATYRSGVAHAEAVRASCTALARLLWARRVLCTVCSARTRISSAVGFQFVQQCVSPMPPSRTVLLRLLPAARPWAASSCCSGCCVASVPTVAAVASLHRGSLGSARSHGAVLKRCASSSVCSSSSGCLLVVQWLLCGFCAYSGCRGFTPYSLARQCSLAWCCSQALCFFFCLQLVLRRPRWRQ